MEKLIELLLAGAGAFVIIYVVVLLPYRLWLDRDVENFKEQVDKNLIDQIDASRESRKWKHELMEFELGRKIPFMEHDYDNAADKYIDSLREKHNYKKRN